MDSKISNTNPPVAVLGAGSFGTAVANLLAVNSPVFLYARKPEVVEEMKSTGVMQGVKLHPNITPTSDLEMVVDKCTTLFPVVPSSGFRDLIHAIAPMLHPYHVLIHGTKGLDIQLEDGVDFENQRVTRRHVKTMSEVIRDETVVVRVGALAGPNLATELAQGFPAATVVASPFNEVIQEGIRLLKSDKFQVYGNKDIIGIELCGVLKNIIAIASGGISGMGTGENSRGLLISRGMIEMMHIGRLFGAEPEAFMGLAGIGDLVTTSYSTYSRNFTVGNRLAKGETLDEILADMDEVAEGVNTIRIIKKLTETSGLRAPITENLYRVLFENMPVNEAISTLMKYPFKVDVSMPDRITEAT
ncbi:NAD(P)H-dependent glycerol-3-phosphate dehydrogenase [Marinigracilibium pacificum]|uniref:Glycerol-3-phosphate dehydrogenase [NAD(P)+] n=1 Tax=Marinigracilibium pacificum TaxID=2729599 RepID=A0A848J0K0_9BACT|nr:NAD(P)H-dependent glycerol-3-phosphate dehydrogenase [Marinigracilibium pacificum]NMM49045.1 NAD(P)-dependent glycerol-3-phosphate dehydrogenase [Marinigracilibium pacificum]